MRLYPAIRAQMGDWTYYIVRMKMRELASEVQLAHDIYEDRTLSDAIQRTLAGTRVKKDIVGYLANRKDRFFSSIVVAAMDGEPAWSPIEIAEDVVPRVFSQSRTLNDSFGVLSFGEEPKYYALDGQHRLAAIKLLVTGDAGVEPPDNFDDDMLSVIVVLREEHDIPEGEWLRRYRKLFSSLNRYAKATDRDTNIIMDEDDIFAILTRRLITDHEFFKSPGRQKESHRVKTKGKALRLTESHFTSLQTLYAMNEILLSPRVRPEKVDKQVRPSEELIDERYEELSAYWDVILMVLPELRSDPPTMRVHSDEDAQDHFLFWPIGQELFARIVRDVLDRDFKEHGRSNIPDMQKALSALSSIPWNLHSVPWRNLILVRDKGSWNMRNEERKEAISIANRLLSWFLRIDSLDIEDTKILRDDWKNLLYPFPGEDEAEEMWKEVIQIALEIDDKR